MLVGKTKLHTIYLLLFLSSLLLTASAFPQQRNFKVVDIEVEGNRVATKSLILGVSAIDKGSPLTPTSVQETIRRLYGLGIFSSVEIQAEEVLGGLKVYIVVKELPKLSGLDFYGNDKIKDKDLKEKLGLGVGGYISPYLINLKLEEIKKLYNEKGYFRTKVTSELDYNADSTEARLIYHIDEKSKIKVQEVYINGNERIPDGDLIGKMRNRKRGFLKSSDFDQEKYDEDKEKVIEEFHKKGFIDAYLISDSIFIDTNINRMFIYLDVYEGPKYYFGNTVFEGNDVIKTENLEKGLKYNTGDAFNSEKYEQTLQELYSAYQEIGYLHARIFDERTTRTDSILDFHFEVSEGLPSHINMVRIVGNYKTKDKVIRRELHTLPGDVFNLTRLIRSVRDVMALNFFETVEPVPVDLPNGDVDIEYQVKEKHTAQVSAGTAYNSQDKFVGSFGMGIPNFRGMGQNLSFNVEYGAGRNSLSLSFTEPWLFGRPTLLGTNLYTINRNWYDDYTESRQGGSVRIGRRLRWPDNYFRLYASYRLERNRFHEYDDSFVFNNSYKKYTYKNIPDSNDVTTQTLVVDTLGPYPGSILEYNEEWNTASRISLTLVRDSRNLPEFATNGSLFSYIFENTGGILGGYWEYQKHSFSAAKFFPLFWGMALAAKVDYGVITSPKGDHRILVSDRFNPGGTAFDGVVRGYDDGDLTPDSLVTQSDTVIVEEYDQDSLLISADTSFSTYRVRVRGKYMLVSNVELQIPLAKNQLYGLLFFDAGNSWLHREDMKFNGLYTSVGFGFRVNVPGLGIIGFDFGYPLRDFRDQGKKLKTHFQFGTTFR